MLILGLKELSSLKGNLSFYDRNGSWIDCVGCSSISIKKKKKKGAFMVTVSSEVYVVLKTRIRDGSLVPIGEDVRKLQHRTLQTKYGLEIKLPPITT